VVTNEKADSHFVILIRRRNKKGLEGPDSPFCSLNDLLGTTWESARTELWLTGLGPLLNRWR
jgi:hypothetical protein